MDTGLRGANTPRVTLQVRIRLKPRPTELQIVVAQIFWCKKSSTACRWLTEYRPLLHGPGAFTVPIRARLIHQRLQGIAEGDIGASTDAQILQRKPTSHRFSTRRVRFSTGVPRFRILETHWTDAEGLRSSATPGLPFVVG